MYRWINFILCWIGALLFVACEDTNHNNENIIKFATSADYPPFEFYKDGTIQGFDVDLAQLIAKELGKKAVIQDMPFSTIMISLQSGTIDAGIATITATEERKKNFMFSDPYYYESLAAIFKKRGRNQLT